MSAHVRHGDKASEMTLVPFRDYWLAANFSVASRNMFVSTEDPGVIEEAKSVAGWRMIWVDQQRLDTGTIVIRNFLSHVPFFLQDHTHTSSRSVHRKNFCPHF